MQALQIPPSVWLNLVLLVAAGAYVALRLSRRAERKRSRPAGKVARSER